MAFETLPQQTLLQRLAESLPSREEKVTEWLANLPADFSLESSRVQDDVTKFVIRGHLNNIYEMLYWPFLDAYLNMMENRDIDEGRAQEHQYLIQLNEAMFGKQIRSLAEAALRKHLERIELNRLGFKHRHHGTWPMIRTCTRSALLLLKTALSIQQSSFPPDQVAHLCLPLGWQECCR